MRGRWWWWWWWWWWLWGRGFLFCQVEKSGFNKGLKPARVWRFYSAAAVSVSVSAPVALSLPNSQLSEGLLWPFADATLFQRLMNWLSGCCQCVCVLGEGVLVTGGNPSYGILPGATIVTVLQGAWGGGCWPPEQPWPTYCCHTPGDRVARAPTRGSDWPRQNDSAVESSNSTGKLPDCAKPLDGSSSEDQKGMLT